MSKSLLYLTGSLTIAAAVLQTVLRGGAPDTPTEWLAPIGPAVFVSGLLWIAFDRWLWRRSTVRKMHGRPVLDGTWHGTLTSTFVRDDGTPVPPDDDVYLVVRQRFSAISVRLFTAESQSQSRATVLEEAADGAYQVVHLYENTPQAAHIDRSPKHMGGSVLHAPSRDGGPLHGYYFTGRRTTGDLEFTARRNGHAGSHREAKDLMQAPPRPSTISRAIAAVRRRGSRSS